MNTIAPPAIHLVHRLIQLARAASYENSIAATHVHDPAVRSVLESGANEHAGHAREWEEFVSPADRNLVGDSMPPSLQDPDWSDLARAIVRGDEHGVLEACACAQRGLLAAFTAASTDPSLTSEAAEILREQTEEVAARHSLLHVCCDHAPQEA